jgi:hypothetical protein
MTRLNRYKSEEHAAEERFSATCRMTKDRALGRSPAPQPKARRRSEVRDPLDPFEQTLGG